MPKAFKEVLELLFSGEKDAEVSSDIAQADAEVKSIIIWLKINKLINLNYIRI